MPRKANAVPLTREMIVAAASRLIADEGVEAFSLRKLAALLNVNPMAIYYYLPSKEAILQAVIEEALSVLHLPPAESWQTAVRHVAAAYYAFAKTHPELFAYVVTYQRQTPIAFAADEYLVQALLDIGIRPRWIVQIVYTVINTVGSLPLGEFQGTFGHARDIEEVYQEFRQLPAEDFPAIRSLTAQLSPDDLRADYDFALEVLIAGIEAQIERTR